MTRAVLSVGSNVGDRLAHLRSVADALSGVLVAASPIYATDPWGGVEQEDYLNAVLIAADDRAVAAWLDCAHELERAAGRTRDVRWGARTLDVDVIDVDGIVRDDPTLTLPHPRAAERAFVLVPWLQADPAATLRGVPVSGLLSTVDSTGVRLRTDLRWRS